MSNLKPAAELAEAASKPSPGDSADSRSSRSRANAGRRTCSYSVAATSFRRDGRLHHFWAREPGGTEDPGQDARGAPDPTPSWNILDLTPGGRGTDRDPALR